MDTSLLEEPFWSITQALAWIALGDPSKGELPEAPDYKHARRLSKRPGDAPKFELDRQTKRPVLVPARQGSALMTLRVAFSVAPADARWCSPDDAEGELIRACKADKQQASGLLEGAGPRQRLDRTHWIGAKFSAGSDQRSVVLRCDNSTWHDVQFDSAEIRRQWPRDAKTTLVETSNTATPPVQTEVESTMGGAAIDAWLLARHARLGGKQPPSQVDLQDECEAENPGKHIPRARFREAVKRSPLYVSRAGVRR
jgi:hypothetical protein